MNLEFKEVLIEGFQSIHRIHTDLNDLGTVLIKGINEYELKSQSNGSGKSSIAESIIWCLYGTTSAGITNPTNKYTSTGCLVSVTLYLDSEKYKITRTCDHATYKNSLAILHNDEDISGRNKSDSDKILHDLLPMSQDIFLSTVFLSQGFSSRLSCLSPSARKGRLEELTQTDKQLDMFKNTVSDSLSSWRCILNDANQELSSNRAQVEILQNEVSRTQSIIDEYTSSDAEPSIDIEALQSKSDNLNDKILDLSQKKSSLESSAMTLRMNLDQNKASFTNNYKRIGELESLIDSLRNKICPICKQPYDTEDSRNLLESYNNEVNFLSSQNIELEKSTSDKQTEVEEIKSQLSDVQIRLDKFRSVYQSVRKIINDNPIKPHKDLTDENKRLSEYLSRIHKLKLDQSDLITRVDNAQTHAGAAEHIQYLISRQFRNHLLSNTIRYLNQKLGEYSTKLFSEDIIRITDDTNKLDIYLGDTKYESLSGGEKRKVDLAVTLAQRDLASSISNTSCNLIILDETLEHLDEVATESALSLLLDTTSDLSSVFVITHNNYEIPYDVIWTITKDDSRISHLSVE